MSSENGDHLLETFNHVAISASNCPTSKLASAHCCNGSSTSQKRDLPKGSTSFRVDSQWEAREKSELKGKRMGRNIIPILKITTTIGLHFYSFQFLKGSTFWEVPSPLNSIPPLEPSLSNFPPLGGVRSCLNYIFLYYCYYSNTSKSGK